VRALGRVLADGLIADDKKIDMVQLALTAMADLERPHVMVLDLLTNYFGPVLIHWSISWAASCQSD
jgi:hypothetical protein